MLQALLAERFKLTYHRETRPLPCFALSLQNAGAPVRSFVRPARSHVPAEPECRDDGTNRRTPLESVTQILRDGPCGRVLAGVLPNDRSQAWAGGRG
jgi:uncharacterized protein (TIGR03435 family)